LIKCNEEIDEEADQQLIESVRRCYRLRSIKRKTDRDIRPSFKHNKGESYVRLNEAIDDIDISQIDILAECIKKYDPSRFDERKFDDATHYGGGNDVIFLTGFMSLIMPEFIQHLTALASVSGEEAGFRPHASHLGFRCIEKLTYHPGGKLLYHLDGGSVYTLVLMLAGETEYSGGEFQIINQNNVVSSYKAPKGGGIFFDSNRDHGVTPLIAGERHVLAVEFWPYEDTSIHDRRPDVETYFNLEKIPGLIEVLPYQQEESDLEGKETEEEEEEEPIDPITVRGEKLSSAAYRKLLKQRNKERRERIKARARDHREKVESSKKERDNQYTQRQKDADRKHKQEQSQNRKQQYSTKRLRRKGPFGIDIDLSRGFAFGLILGAVFPLILVNFFVIRDSEDYSVRNKFSSYKPDRKLMD